MAAELIPPQSQGDPELVRRVPGRRTPAASRIGATPYERAVFITTYAILRDHADAEEAAQETMLKAHMHLDQLAVPEKFKSWLLQIAVNEARRKRRSQHANLFEPLDGNPNPGAEEPFMPRDFADWRELPMLLSGSRSAEYIARALHSLPKIYGETFILRDAEQLSACRCGTGYNRGRCQDSARMKTMVTREQELQELSNFIDGDVAPVLGDRH